MQSEQQAAVSPYDNGIDANSVLRYLTLNPDFFNQHADILSGLRIPHHTGAAVSLVEKQVSVLRKKSVTLENKLTELISVARENEQLHQRMHGLVQEVISATSVDEIISLTRDSLIENFHADDVRVILIDKINGTAHRNLPDRYLAFNAPELDLFSAVFDRLQTVCGLPDPWQCEFLFGERQFEVGSAAIIPLFHGKNLGLVVLSSHDAHRFDSGKGVMFLDQLGELLGRRIASFL